jgi:ubiquinone/menaquinone biosynthesis C-methylase UbiE
MASQIGDGKFEGIDFSETMVSMAQKRNKENIHNGQVKILKPKLSVFLILQKYFDLYFVSI